MKFASYCHHGHHLPWHCFHQIQFGELYQAVFNDSLSLLSKREKKLRGMSKKTEREWWANSLLSLREICCEVSGIYKEECCCAWKNASQQTSLSLMNKWVVQCLSCTDLFVLGLPSSISTIEISWPLKLKESNLHAYRVLICPPGSWVSFWQFTNWKHHIHCTHPLVTFLPWLTRSIM